MVEPNQRRRTTKATRHPRYTCIDWIMEKTMLKSLFQSFSMARDFNLQMKKLKVFKPKMKIYKTPLTKAQMGILEYCAFIGVKDFHALAKLTKIERPTLKQGEENE